MVWGVVGRRGGQKSAIDVCSHDSEVTNRPRLV